MTTGDQFIFIGGESDEKRLRARVIQSVEDGLEAVLNAQNDGRPTEKKQVNIVISSEPLNV